MALNPAGAIAGAVTTGFTSPTYTWTVDQPPAPNAKQWYVSAIGGTQTGVETSQMADSPWTITFFRPTLKVGPGVTNAGNLNGNPRNVWNCVFRKGVIPNVNVGAHATAIIRTEFNLPAGCETSDAADLGAGLGSWIGFLSNQANGLFDSFKVGSL